MLGTLLKYELKATARIMIPVLLAMLAATAVLGLNVRFENQISVLVNIVIVLLFILTMIASVIISVILVLQRFHKNLLGREGYLMFTLPVRTGENIAAKALTAFLWTIAGIATSMVCGLILVCIMGDWSEFWSSITEGWDQLMQWNGRAVRAGEILLLLVMLVLGIMQMIMKVYASISVGHQWGSHRVAGSILSYIGFSVIEIAVSMLIGRNQVFLTGTAAMEYEGITLYNNIGLNYAEVWIAIVVYLVVAVIYGAITWYFLDRRLNLE